MYPTVDPIAPAGVAPSGISRRSFFRFAAGASALASLPILTEAHLALRRNAPNSPTPTKASTSMPTRTPWVLREAARQAMVDIVPRGGRYLFSGEEELAEIFAKQEGLERRVGDCLRRLKRAAALHRAGVHRQGQAAGRCRPRLRSADVGGQGERRARSSRCRWPIPRAKPSTTSRRCSPLTSNPGVIYICNPNNPTGTCTPRSDIEYAVANAPKDTVILIDEAYIHLCDAPRSHRLREGRQERHRPAHLLQALWHGRHPHGLRHWPSGPARRRSRRLAE